MHFKNLFASFKFICLWREVHGELSVMFLYTPFPREIWVVFCVKYHWHRILITPLLKTCNIICIAIFFFTWLSSSQQGQLLLYWLIMQFVSVILKLCLTPPDQIQYIDWVICTYFISLLALFFLDSWKCVRKSLYRTFRNPSVNFYYDENWLWILCCCLLVVFCLFWCRNEAVQW